MQKDVSKGFPAWLERVEVPKKDGTVHHPHRHRHAVAALDRQPEQHHAARVDVARAGPLSPGHLRLRSRPVAGRCRTPCAPPRSALRDLLEELGLPSWVKTSGSKGFHIVVPLDGNAEYGRGRAASRTRVGAMLVQRDPEHLTQEFSKADRGRRILVDTGRNGYSATFAARLRRARQAGRAGLGAVHVGGGRAAATVGPQTFTLRTMAARVAEVGDLWSDLRKRGRSLRRAIEKLRRIS